MCVAVGFHRCIVYLCCRIELTCFFFVHLHTFKFPVVEIPKWSKPFLLCQCLHQRYMRVDLLFFKKYISLVCVCTFYDISLNRWLGCSLTASFSHCGLKHTYSSIYVFIRYWAFRDRFILVLTNLHSEWCIFWNVVLRRRLLTRCAIVISVLLSLSLNHCSC